MKKVAFIKSFALLTLAWLMLCSFKSVTDEDMLSSGYTAEELEALKEDTIAGQTGVVEFASCHARIMVPTDLVYPASEVLENHRCRRRSHSSRNKEDIRFEESVMRHIR